MTTHVRVNAYKQLIKILKHIKVLNKSKNVFLSL